MINNWLKKHLIELEALILRWPCRGLECRQKIITNLGSLLSFMKRFYTLLSIIIISKLNFLFDVILKGQYSK